MLTSWQHIHYIISFNTLLLYLYYIYIILSYYAIQYKCKNYITVQVIHKIYITYIYFLSRISFILQTLSSHATKFSKLSKHTKQNSSFTFTTGIISVHLSYIAFWTLSQIYQRIQLVLYKKGKNLLLMKIK